jgi:hypothetical protein
MPDNTIARDPFAPADNAVARLAVRIGVTEGTLYSLAIGALALWALVVNIVPGLQWHAVGAAPPPFALSAAPTPTPAPVVVAPPPTQPTLLPLPLPNPAPLGPVGVGSSPDPIAPFPETTGSPSSQGPLRITGGGYAAADAGTPLATAGVPDGSVAVGSRAGQVDKVTYLRLVGDPGLLQLKVDASGSNVLDADAVLAACPVTQAGWKVGHGDVTPAAGPQYSCSLSSPGVRSSDGTTWAFDLSSLDMSNGVAIVPVVSTTEVTKSFQVVFNLTP